MATTKEYIDYVCESIKDYGIVINKKMFGEYMVYLNSKPILLVCNSTVYIKMLDEIKEIMASAETGYPYNGAKLHYILDIEDKTIVSKVIPLLEKLIPIPKPIKKKEI